MRIFKMYLVLLFGCAIAGCGSEKPLTEYKDPAGKFTIQFPGTPKSSSTKGQADLTVHELIVDGGSWAYTLSYYDSQGRIPDTENGIKIALHKEISALYSHFKGETTEDSGFIKLQDEYHGLEHAGKVSKPKELSMRGRCFVVGDRIYHVVVRGSADKVKSETATKFLDSFKVVREKEQEPDDEKAK